MTSSKDLSRITEKSALTITFSIRCVSSCLARLTVNDAFSLYSCREIMHGFHLIKSFDKRGTINHTFFTLPK